MKFFHFASLCFHFALLCFYQLLSYFMQKQLLAKVEHNIHMISFIATC